VRRYLSLEPPDPTRLPRWVRHLRARLRGIRPLHRLVVRWRHRGISAQDAFLVAYPKSGTTWLAGMLAHLATGRELDFGDHDELTPPVGSHVRARPILGTGRLIRSHEAASPGITDGYARVVYMVRDGRDVAVSYFHDFRRKGMLDRSFDEFFEAFLMGDLDAWGPWSAHITSWLDSPQAESGTLLVVRYEDLVSRPEAELLRVATFLGLPVDTERVAATVAIHTASRMREREIQWRQANSRNVAADALFVRSANPGEHQGVLSTAQQARFAATSRAQSERLGYAVGARPASPP
jgi:hypothetical protein